LSDFHFILRPVSSPYTGSVHSCSDSLTIRVHELSPARMLRTDVERSSRSGQAKASRPREHPPDRWGTGLSFSGQLQL